jgi:hypothetical protein
MSGPALVGTIGAIGQSKPSWGTGATRAAGNLLVCWAGDDAGVTPLTINSEHSAPPDVWQTAVTKHNGAAGAAIFYRIATGGEAAPWVHSSQSNVSIAAQLGEFSGVIGLDEVGSAIGNQGASSPIVATCATGDAASESLVAFGAFMRGGTVGTHTVNNGVVVHASATGNVSFGYGVTTGNSAIDSDSFSFTGYTYGAPLVLASFKPLLAPVNTVAPLATGMAQVGNTLSTTDGTWLNTPDSYAYQWQRDGTNISGATASTHVLVTADVGTTVSCVVTATNLGGSGLSYSNGIGPIANLAIYVDVAQVVETGLATVVAPMFLGAPVNIVKPAISGTTTVGQVLSTSDGTWELAPTSFTYQWRRST